jgi:hypothetical protein
LKDNNLPNKKIDSERKNLNFYSGNIITPQTMKSTPFLNKYAFNSSNELSNNSKNSNKLDSKDSLNSHKKI